MSAAGFSNPARPRDPRAEHDRSTIDDFLEGALIHERAGGFVPTRIFWLAVLADVALLVLVWVGSTVDAAGIRDSGFFLFGGDNLAGVVSFLQGLAAPLLVLAGVGLLLKLWIVIRPTPAAVHVFCGLETCAGGGMAIGWAGVLAWTVFMFFLWLVIITFFIAMGLVFLGAVLRG